MLFILYFSDSISSTPPVFQKADAVRTSTFTGCMGETFLDSKPIGLWNYRERHGDCKGCVVRYQHLRDQFPS